MSPIEIINQQIEELKQCTAKDISKHFAIIITTFPMLSRDDKTLVASSFMTWAKQNAMQQPLKLGYAEYINCIVAFFYEDYETALIHAQQALQIFEEYQQADAIALCASMFGSIYRPLGNIDLALKSFWEGYHQLKINGVYQHNLMACEYHIASMYLEMGKHNDALPMLTSTLQLANELKNPIWIMNARHGLGKYYLSLKNFTEAKAVLEEAKSVADRINNPLFTANTITDLANYYFEVGEYNQAITLSNEALAIRQEHKYLGGAVTNLIRIAEISIIEGVDDDAITALNKGLAMAMPANLKPKIFQIHKLLSEIYERKNSFEESLKHYKLYHQINLQVTSEDNEKKVKNLQLVFEAEQTKKENIIIKKQKQEIETKNIELQETIDELTRTKVGKKAKAFTMAIAIVLFILEEIIIHFTLHQIGEDNFYVSFVVKMVIIFSLKPIDSAIEHALLKKIIKKKKMEVLIN